MATHCQLRFGAAALLSFFFASAANFVHPGVFLGVDRLSLIAANTVNGTGLPPVPAFWASMLKSQFARQETPLGPPPGGVITCGFFSHPDIGCGNETVDSAAAFIHALIFAVNGSAPHGAAAVAILNAYGSQLTLYNDSNAPLQAAWSGSKWVRAAELMKSTAGSPWAASDAAAFIAMLYRVTLPLIYNGSLYNGNWELSMIEAMMGLAVLSDNATLFDHALGMWAGRVPAYFYTTSDGPSPRPDEHGSVPYWYNQLTFNASVNGICQETCRDLGHTSFGLAATFNAAETAFLQGVDVYGNMSDRLTAALEFHSNLLLGAPVPAYVCNGTGVKYAEAPTFEVAYNAYHNRRGVPLPLTEQHILTQVRNTTSPVIYMMVYESLTHGAAANVTSQAQ